MQTLFAGFASIWGLDDTGNQPGAVQVQQTPCPTVLRWIESMETVPDGKMTHSRLKKIILAFTCVTLVASCGDFKKNGFKDRKVVVLEPSSGRESGSKGRVESGTSLFDAFKGGKAEVKVNRFLWTATLDVLNFLPVQTADPFTGLISTGFGRPPGGGQAYRATVLITDPALDARSLKLSLQTQRGPVSGATQRAVEDAILARARQLRIGAGKF